MSFKAKMKQIDKKEFKDVKIHPSFISAQYNPDRFHLWKKTCVNVADDNFLHMRYSPHVNFLKLFEQHGGTLKGQLEGTNYYKMHRNYGKSDDWTKNKIKTFLSIYKDIKSNGIKEPPIILTGPIVKNPYNGSYEIFEGHHRCAIALFLEMPIIKCKLKTV